MFSLKMNSKGETRQAQNARVRNIVMFRFLLEILTIATQARSLC